MDKVTIQMDNPAVSRRYDLLPPRDLDLGLYVAGVGTRSVPRQAPYQVHEKGAPFQWHNGRVLSSYGLVYLSGGEGTFQTQSHNGLRMKAGDMLVLTPNEWHDYAPDPEVGWREYWVLFSGSQAAIFAQRLACLGSTPLLRPSLPEPLLHLFGEMLGVAESKPAYFDVILSGLMLQLLAYNLRCLQRTNDMHAGCREAVIKAKQYLKVNLHTQVDMPALASGLGMSYRHFRRVFKASTGMAPQQYLLNLRINFAKRLLEEKVADIKEVACLAGFDDPYYFSRIFHSKTGNSPSQWRQSA